MSEVKTETKQEVKVRQAAKKDAEQKKTVMYIGPSIKNVVSTGSLYNNGLPEKLTQAMEKQPAIKSLIVPLSGLAAAQKELAIPGSALSIIYGKVNTK